MRPLLVLLAGEAGDEEGAEEDEGEGRRGEQKRSRKTRAREGAWSPALPPHPFLVRLLLLFQILCSLHVNLLFISSLLIVHVHDFCGIALNCIF